ncbi:MAG: S-methyl-5'-thioadenosine phosphorylase [Actinomycetota bacterium]|nr:S-methyl-5'-thioadenosine phosphorylase [Actinomycetota bacterium]
MVEPRATVGVFGGSGFYSFLEDVTEVEVETPYGPPAAAVTIGEVARRNVAFLPRHGRRHEYPPHRIPFRANLWAMRELGVRHLLAPCASGSLQPHIAPGHFVVCDQLIDRTWGREGTFHDGPTVEHLAFADPYDPALRALVVEVARADGIEVHDGGTVVVIQGPRFSTRAESRFYRTMGCDVINMTQAPEAALAAELAIPYVAIALVTDYDTGVEGDDGVEPVTQEAVFTFFEQNVERVRELLVRVIGHLPTA